MTDQCYVQHGTTRSRYRNGMKCYEMFTSSYIFNLFFTQSKHLRLQDPVALWPFSCQRFTVLVGLLLDGLLNFPPPLRSSIQPRPLTCFQPPSALLNVFQAVSIGFHVLLVSKTAACRFLSSQGDFFTRRGCQVSLSLQSHFRRGRGGRQRCQSCQSCQRC